MNDIVKREDNYISLATDGEKLADIISSVNDKSVGFRTIDQKALAKISDFMPEANRAMSVFSKQNSQTTASLMTLQMLEAGPYRTLRQIMAQVAKKRSALKEALYKTEKKRIKLQKLQDKLIEAEDLDAHEIELQIWKVNSDIADSTTYIESALKELGAYQQRYYEVMKNHNIPENWDEEDFERAEIEHHIKAMFRNAIRDRMQGTHNNGTMEYFEQFGINPVTAYACVDQYLNDIRRLINETGMGADINAEYDFLDRMYETFKDEYKKAMKRVGLDSITAADFIMKEHA